MTSTRKSTRSSAPKDSCSQPEPRIRVAAFRRLAPTPIHTPTFPWRFALGDFVYVKKSSPTETVEIVGGELWANMPHLKVRDAYGAVWQVPQLHCSSKTISFRKG